MLLEQKNNRVPSCKEIVCVKMFLRPFFHAQYDQSVAERQKYVLILESSGCLKTAKTSTQPNFLNLFCFTTVYQISAELTKHHTDIFTPNNLGGEGQGKKVLNLLRLLMRSYYPGK